jgi:hypothetical protein
MASEDPWLQDDQDPMFFSLLDDDDQRRYLDMRSVLRNSEKRYKRNKRIESLQDSLDTIQEFCVRNLPDDWKRSLVCGVCWMGQEIAVNTRQLRLLVNKCKSSINGALSKMGYGTAPVKSVMTQSLLAYIPYLKGNFVEQRQWTVRRKVSMSPVAMRNSYPTPIFLPSPSPAFETPEPLLAGPPIDDLKVFGIPELGKDLSVEPDDDSTYNFITDPCCCCPIHWARDEGNIDDLFKFA